MAGNERFVSEAWGRFTGLGTGRRRNTHVGIGSGYGLHKVKLFQSLTGARARHGGSLSVSAGLAQSWAGLFCGAWLWEFSWSIPPVLYTILNVECWAVYV